MVADDDSSQLKTDLEFRLIFTTELRTDITPR